MERAMKSLHNSPEAANYIYQLYGRSQVDYGLHFLHIYISYNAWYREATGMTNDRQALSLLKKRFIIWDDYIKGRTLNQLKPYMKRLTELSQQKPFVSTRLYWSGEFEGSDDWRSLIEFWYQTRCLIVHGSDFRQKHAWLAYETLTIFMKEIIERMQACFNDADLQEMESYSSLADEDIARSARFKKLQQRLYQKYVASPDIWQVDMQRVESGL